MKKVGVAISLLLNVFLLAGLVIVHSYDTNNCKSEEPKKEEASTVQSDHSLLCTKKITDQEIPEGLKSYSSRIEITYSDDGTITKLLSGAIFEYADNDLYEKSKTDENARDLGDQKIFYFVEADAHARDDSGKEYEMWFKDYVRSLKEDGYTCQ